jgi:hypothetical protein
MDLDELPEYWMEKERLYDCRMSVLFVRTRADLGLDDEVLEYEVVQMIKAMEADLVPCWRVETAIALARSMLILGRPHAALDAIERIIWHDQVAGR